MNRSTFNENDHALYKLNRETVSVRIIRCSYYCPPFDNNPEQSFYTVQLDGDIAPVEPKFQIHGTLIHRVPLAELEQYEPSVDYATNTGLWTLKMAAAETEQKYAAAVSNVQTYGQIRPGTTVVWQNDYCPRALKTTVQQIDLLKGHCVVEDGSTVKLSDVISWYVAA